MVYKLQRRKISNLYIVSIFNSYKLKYLTANVCKSTVSIYLYITGTYPEFYFKGAD